LLLRVLRVMHRKTPPDPTASSSMPMTAPASGGTVKSHSRSSGTGRRQMASPEVCLTVWSLCDNRIGQDQGPD